ncbi:MULTISPECIES: SPOR domain-containing protein [Methylomonas]|uniref:SPOR domain-containing protein n=1 Tax=Methylomonas TaxID=416 RepID=UPI001232003D|nr:SPOR domain-containing protein [Methylomonas rhizoryzae]
MARDYKHRVQSSAYSASRRQAAKQPPLWRRWLLVLALIAVFGAFLHIVSRKVEELLASRSGEPAQTNVSELKTPEQPPDPKPVAAVQPVVEPRYDFYTILPQAETVIPDYEIQSRVREELVGKSKAVRYVMQAGSFREGAEAERHKAKLALLGIEARVEKAKVGSAIWHRVKIGPYDNPSSVAKIKELLQKNNIGVVVTEQGQ